MATESSSSSPSSPAQRRQVYGEILRRLIESGDSEAIQPGFHRELFLHLDSLPLRYAVEVNAESIPMHKKLLQHAHEHEFAIEVGKVQSISDGNSVKDSDQNAARYALEANSAQDQEDDRSVGPIHEITFAADKPELVSQLTSSLAEKGINIREAHAFSTVDGYSLDIFVVDGWPYEVEYSLSSQENHVMQPASMNEFNKLAHTQSIVSAIEQNKVNLRQTDTPPEVKSEMDSSSSTYTCPSNVVPATYFLMGIWEVFLPKVGDVTLKFEWREKKIAWEIVGSHPPRGEKGQAQFYRIESKFSDIRRLEIGEMDGRDGKKTRINIELHNKPSISKGMQAVSRIRWSDDPTLSIFSDLNQMAVFEPEKIKKNLKRFMGHLDLTNDSQ